MAELNHLAPIITKAIEPYSQRFAGFSPKQISQAISGDNTDQQAQYLAARALQPEMAAMRVKALGGQVGIEAIREVQNASQANLKAFQGLITPDIYTKSQQYMDQWINEANQSAYNQMTTGKFPSSSAAPSSPATNDPLGIR